MHLHVTGRPLLWKTLKNSSDLWNGNECGKKTKVMRILRQPYEVQPKIDQKQLVNVEHFNHLDSMVTNDARCTCEIKWWEKLSTA